MSNLTPPAGTPTPTPRTPGGSKRWQPPAPAELQALLPDDYTVEKLLGRGGMGAVYQGRRLSLDRAVSIKILSTDLEDTDTRYVERFKNEARAMAQLSHPGIVGVYGFGETNDGLLYIVMEFIAGTDVARMIKEQGRLRTEHAMAIAAHVCDALAFAHERGIIHRDIKPANIMVGYDGVVKVADFGLAKMTVDGATLGLTKSGMAMGTLHYMAPEALILGTAVDHRADIYAVGVMLYQMLTGKLPQGVVDPPSEQVPGLDPRYDAIIAKAMSEDRDERYQSIRELRSDLDATLTKPVVKVEAEAAQAPAALTTTARPQRPAGHASRSTLEQLTALYAELPFPWRVGLMLGCSILVLWGAAYLWFRPPPTTGLAKTDGLVAKTTPENAPTAAPGTTPSPPITPSNPPSPPTIPAPQETAAKSFAGAALAPPPPAIQATKEQPFVNSLGMKFVPVPGTKVLFCIHETRRQDYAAYAAAAPGVDGSWQNQKTNYGIPSVYEDNHPACGLSWMDAQAFCTWLSKKESKTYRLPTDKEWSYAVGIGENELWTNDSTPESLIGKLPNHFPWEGAYPPKTEDLGGNYADTAFKEKLNHPFIKSYTDGFVTTAPVMSFKPNKFGLYDLGGNVWEWCADWWNAEQKDRILRGASFYNDDRNTLLSSYRLHPAPANRHYNYGFRCVLETSPSTAATDSVVPPPSVPTASKPVPLTSITATANAPFTNSLGMQFVPVPGTKVLFCIHETRYQDYAAYAAAVSGEDGSWKNQKAGRGKEQHPVVNVDWLDATAFCRWLSKKESKTYRLPTDQEWSYAVGIGSKEDRTKNATPANLSGKVPGEYPWGGSYPPQTADRAGNYADTTYHENYPTSTFIEGYTDGFPFTAPVMRFKPNQLGLYDLGGNVWEWCEDWYDNLKTRRVLRGGAWNCGGRGNLLSSGRFHYAPGLSRQFHYGFRVVIVVSGG